MIGLLILSIPLVIMCGTPVRKGQELQKKRECPSFCVDPFTSEDMGRRTYTPCKLVPMWSTKA